MFLDGLWRGDSGCHGSSLAGEVSRPHVCLITAWPPRADTFLLSDFFPFSLHTFATPNGHLNCPFYAIPSPRGCAKCQLFITQLYLICCDIFQGFWGLCFSHLLPSPVQTPAHAVTDSQKRLCGCLLRPLFSLGFGGGPPFSLSSILLRHAPLRSAFLNTETLLFVIVPSDECLAILWSGGFGRGWTNDLGSFVPNLKGLWDSADRMERSPYLILSAPLWDQFLMKNSTGELHLSAKVVVWWAPKLRSRRVVEEACLVSEEVISS